MHPELHRGINLPYYLVNTNNNRELTTVHANYNKIIIKFPSPTGKNLAPWNYE